MFFKGIAFNGKTVSFNRQLKYIELRLLYQLLKDFFKNEPAYEALASFEETDLIKKFHLIKTENFLDADGRIIKKVFDCYKNELVRHGYIKYEKKNFLILEKPLEHQNYGY